MVYVMNGGQELKMQVTFGLDQLGHVKEVFGRASKTGTDLQGLISDGCIAVSLLLQHGMSIEEVAVALGENRPEGEKSGPPASPLGAIARAGVEVERACV
jgi:hypothetical protein